VISAAVEWGAGVGLAIAPSLTASLLVGGSLDTAAGATVGRVAGAALISLGTACWLARSQEHSSAAAGLIVAMLIYNVAAAAILAAAGTVSRLTAIALWPTVALHAGMAAWSLACVFSTPVSLSARGA